MKGTRQTFVSFLLLVLFGVAQSSNPDSEIVQDKSSDSNGSCSKMSAALRSEESQPRSIDLDRYPVTRRVIVLRPIRSGTEIIWRQVSPEGTGRVYQNPNNAWRNLMRNPPDLIVQVDDESFADVSSSSTVRVGSPERPQNIDKGNNANVPQYSNRNGVVDGMTPDGAVSGGIPVNVYRPQRPQNNGEGSSNNANVPQFGNRNGMFSGRTPDNNANSGESVYGYRLQRPQNDGGRRNNNVPQVSEGTGASNFPSVASNNGGISSFSAVYGGQNSRNNGNLPTGAQNPSGFGLDLNEQNRRPGSIPFNRGFDRTNPDSNVPGRVATTPNRRVSPDSNLFAGIVNDFAFKLVKTMNLEKNFVVSPLSIFIALSMCYLGTDGKTKAQLEQALGMNDNAVHGEHLHQGIKDLISLVTPRSSEYQLFTANGMFLGKNFTYEAQFAENIKKYYDAELKNVDFKDPQSSIPVMNNWVAQKTMNMITNLIDAPPPEDTRLILLNAIYFKGIWKMKFPQTKTYNGEFQSLDGTTKEIPTMSLVGQTFPLYRSNEHRHTFIKLPYGGDQISMIIALPYAESEKPMTSVTDQILCYVQDAMKDTLIDTVAIPKFRLEHAKSLRSTLVQLGISDLFSRNADLRMLRKQRDLFVSSILHKTVVDVNEEGTTAAAATSVNFVGLTLKNSTDFVADHPFAFYIVHEPSGLVLFYGKIFDTENIGGVSEGNPMSVRQRPNPQRGDATAYRNPSRMRL